MSLLQMSFSGAVLILAVTLIRTAAINRLPKKTFLIMWGIVLIRLLLPFSVPSVYSAYSLIHRNMPANISAMAPAGHGSAAPQWEYAGSASLIHANGTEEDYRSLLSLKTENYQDMSVASFGKALLDWGNEHFDSYERIEEDLIRDDFQVNLSEDERSFVTITRNLTRF